MDPSGKTVAITGGASGLGEATARRLAEAGARIGIMDTNAERGEAVARELGDAGFFVRCDVTATAEVEAAIERIHAQWGGLHALVNCAGRGLPQRTISREGPADLEAFQKTVAINLFGTFDCIRRAAFKMSANEPDADGERGVIVNTASVAAFDGQIGQSAYSASKAAIVGMTLPIARDLSGLGIRINTICPGVFETPLIGGMRDDFKAGLAASVPFPKRFGRPDEFAMLVEQIVRNGYMNGETIRLDGAIRMPPK